MRVYLCRTLHWTDGYPSLITNKRIWALVCPACLKVSYGLKAFSFFSVWLLIMFISVKRLVCLLPFWSELYFSLVTPNTNNNHLDGCRMHKCKGKVAQICFNCCTIMIKQHFYVVWLGSGKMDGLQCYLFSGSQVLGTIVVHCCLD